MNKIIHPEGWAPAKGYANGVLSDKGTLYVGGQIGWTADQVFEAKDFLGQCKQTLENVLAVVEAAGGEVSDLVANHRPSSCCRAVDLCVLARPETSIAITFLASSHPPDDDRTKKENFADSGDYLGRRRTRAWRELCALLRLN